MPGIVHGGGGLEGWVGPASPPPLLPLGDADVECWSQVQPRSKATVHEARVLLMAGGGVWHKASVVGFVSLWRRLLASRP